MERKTLHAQLSADATVQAQLEFAQRCFTNVQELSRFMDQKAGYLLSAISLLTLALGVVASRTLDVPASGGIAAGLYVAGLLSFAVYLIVGCLVILAATAVFRALPHVLPPSASAPGLMFPLILLGRFTDGKGASEDMYCSKLSQVTIDGMFSDYANQIVEVSTIYERKQRLINRSTTLFEVLTGCWILTMLLLVATLILRVS